MNKTPLHSIHIQLGAKMTEFAGWEMPLSYSGQVDEYETVRTAVGLFDVSHMGRFLIEGGAIPFLQRVTVNDVEAIQPGQAQYSMVCNDQGGILDDVFVYRLGNDRFLVCVNASNRGKLDEWFRRHAASAGPPAPAIHDQTMRMGQIAIQGPSSLDLLRRLDTSFPSIPIRSFMDYTLFGCRGTLARTGYTGEHGYEFYLASDDLSKAWMGLLEAGTSCDIRPCGLGARDLLRLEAGFLLYGSDISEGVTPLEAGAERFVSFTKPCFIGREALQRQKAEGIIRTLVGFKLLERGVPRHGYPMVCEGREIGTVTSGNFFPKRQQGLGLGYIKTPFAQVGTRIAIRIRNRTLPAVIVKPPFHRRPSHPFPPEERAGEQ